MLADTANDCYQLIYKDLIFFYACSLYFFRYEFLVCDVWLIYCVGGVYEGGCYSRLRAASVV